MCGLAGHFSSAGNNRSRATVEKMLAVEGHRGPDSRGVWSDVVHGIDVAIGLTRLKILDLSDAANQPMVSPDERYALAYNGEVYNYIELRDALAAAGVRFLTDGDTEVVLQALITWGPSALTRFNGMWALVLVDRVSGTVMLSRDRFGVKPLYTYLNNRGLFVASEIKAILDASGDKFRIDPDVSALYLNQKLLCTGSNSFFEGIEEFPAGHWAVLPANTISKSKLDSRPYWVLPNSTQELSDDELIEAVRSTFIDAVRLRLRSDVPVGVLLSGGLDSSSIAAALHHLDQSQSVGEINLISAVGNGEVNEEHFVDAMGRHLDRPIHKVQLNYGPSEAFSLLSEASWFNDEPIASFSTVAHYLLMKRASELGVTVLLSGQGADEISCGYRKYVAFHTQELLLSGKLVAATTILASFIKARTVLRQVRYNEAKRYLPHWLRLPEVDISGEALRDRSSRMKVGLSEHGVIGRQRLDVEKLSVPALVHYEDRMSMAHAREIRLPFLDYRLVSLLLPLPAHYKLRAGWTKWIFRRAMETLLPKEIAWRKDKQHFIVPQNNWFRSELRESTSRLLAEEWITERLLLIDKRKLRVRYDAYLRQSENGRLSFKDIFSPIALEIWARRFQDYLST